MEPIDRIRQYYEEYDEDHRLNTADGSLEYQRTKDILHVMDLLGHRNMKNTLAYTHLVNFESDEYVSKVARTVKEAQELVEAGFDYICDIEGVKIFRKRK